MQYEYLIFAVYGSVPYYGTEPYTAKIKYSCGRVKKPAVVIPVRVADVVVITTVHRMISIAALDGMQRLCGQRFIFATCQKGMYLDCDNKGCISDDIINF